MARLVMDGGPSSPAVRPSPAVQRPTFPGLGAAPTPNTPPSRSPSPSGRPAPTNVSPASGNRPVSGVTADTAERLQTDYGYTQGQAAARSVNQPVGQVNNVFSDPAGNLTSSTRPSGGGTSAAPTLGGGGAGGGPAGGGGGGSGRNAKAELDALINDLLNPDFINFQGDRDAELRRLRNLRNQLFGDEEFGSTGMVQRQEGLDAASRRRLAAQRAMGGMLQGGAYAGLERGVGTLQRADQDFGMQEMIRPFREQTAADRLRQFGIDYTPEGREFVESDFGSPDDMMGGWASSTFRGQEAAARARQNAIQQLAQRGIRI
jgi:hypothetical protein